MGFLVFPIIGDDRQDGLFKDLVYTSHLLAAALYVLGAHLAGNGAALLLGHGREALCLEHVDARFLEAEIGLEAHENQRSVGAEVEDFGIPLGGEEISISVKWRCPKKGGACYLRGGDQITLSMTFSSEFGQSIAKHTKIKSVSG